MGDLATLLTAIGGLVTALGGSLAVVITAIRSSRRERPAAAQAAAEKVADAKTEPNLVGELKKAITDGKLTAEDLTKIAQELNKETR